jgi:hypothetical protein
MPVKSAPGVFTPSIALPAETAGLAAESKLIRLEPVEEF